MQSEIGNDEYFTETLSFEPNDSIIIKQFANRIISYSYLNEVCKKEVIYI